MQPKKILFLTSTRADFGKLKALIACVQNLPKFECHIFATGMHTLGLYGRTINEIRKCGFKHIFPYINQIAEKDGAMDMVVASTIRGLGHYVREFNPDLIVVHGDRAEALAGAIVGAMNNILIAHIEGGELSGTVDELIRHSVTKLAHIHFAANGAAKRRLIQMGEDTNSIYTIGSPDIDIMLSDRLPTMTAVRRRYGIHFKKYAIFSYHPAITEIKRLKSAAKNVISALVKSDWNFVAIYPNNDPGADIILEALLPLEHNNRFWLFPSIRFECFLTLLKNTRAIVGNSSAGVREAPVYAVPTINIGDRQLNRSRHSSIINVPEQEADILAAMKRLPKKVPHTLHFGKGNSAKLFMKCLNSPKFWNTSCQKQFRDI